ncbi:MAG: GxxExxY protein [Planctomycetes bacterium]|nr:GxxExxY protein [Planctomycetota bacterium]
MEPKLTNRIQALYDCILAGAERVQQALGAGMPLAAYRACLKLELDTVPLSVACDVPVPLLYRDVEVENAIVVPMVCDGLVVVAFEQEPSMSPAMDARMHALLRATGLPMGVIANFGIPAIRAGLRRIANPNPRMEG